VWHLALKRETEIAYDVLMLEFRKSRCREVNTIEMGFKEIVREDVD
jgi:hypothetical protein